MVGVAAAIGPAMTALSKVKAKAWRAMEGAMQEVKNLADPMDVIRSALAFATPILKVIGVILRLLGAEVLKTSLEAVQDLLDLLTDPETIEGTKAVGQLIGEVIIPVIQALTVVLSVLGPAIVAVTNFFQENKAALEVLKFAIAPMANLLLLIRNNWDAIATSCGNAFLAVKNFLDNIIGALFNGLITMINRFMNAITFGAWKDLKGGAFGILDLLKLIFKPKGSRQYGGEIERTGYYRLHKGEEVVSAGKTKTSEIHVHIDLRNAVVDNVDRLSQRIAEQVLIQIG